MLAITNAAISDVTSVNLHVDKITIPLGSITIEIPVEGLVDNSSEIESLFKRKSDLENELVRSNEILNNSNFLSKAPKQKVDIEKEKMAKYQIELDNVIKAIEINSKSKKTFN
jgi:valyl-tRNA synthetase